MSRIEFGYCTLQRVLLPALLFLATFLPALACQSDAADAPATARKPNIVFILADDLGYAELGCYGQKKIRTPRIDQLAREGMKFTDHYSGNAVCATSRCVLMTGQHTGHCEIRDNHGLSTRETGNPLMPKLYLGQAPIPDESITIAELLKQQGYATGAFGKWGLGSAENTGGPLKQGFDRFFGYTCQGHAHNFYPYYVVDNDQPRILEGNNHGLTGKQYVPDLCADESLKFIREHQSEPFFLYYPTTVPHLALQVPDDTLNEYVGQWDDPPYEGGKGYLPHPTPRAAYAAMVTRMDRDVGRMMDLIDELKLTENTIFVFTSDNGPTYDRLGGSDSDFFESAGPLKGLKGSLYEGGIRVPMIVRWPNRVAAGTTSNRPTAFDDWLPTLLDLANSTPSIPQNIDGVSFAPTLTGHPDKQQPREFLYWEFPSYGGQQAVRMGDWKGVRQNLLKKRKPGETVDMSVELYHLGDDIGEQKNVADAHPEIVEKMTRIMQEQHIPSTRFPFAPLDAEAAQSR